MVGPTGLALALAAVLGLILLSRIMGFDQKGKLADPDHAALLAQSLPGGFVVADIAMARDGGGALLRDTGGRVAVIAAIGAHFLVRATQPGWYTRSGGGGKLAISGDDFFAEIDLGDEHERWLAVLAEATAAKV